MRKKELKKIIRSLQDKTRQLIEERDANRPAPKFAILEGGVNTVFYGRLTAHFQHEDLKFWEQFKKEFKRWEIDQKRRTLENCYTY